MVVRRYNIDQPIPTITTIPQAEKIREAIQTIEDEDNHDLLARWDDYGCATYDQLKLMQDVLTARNNFKLVQATVDWIGKVEFHVDNIVEPLKETQDVTKVCTKIAPKLDRTLPKLVYCIFLWADHKHAVEELNLGRWYIGKHVQYGSEFLDFRENVWLHSGSIIGALLMLRETFQAVGVVNPRFQDFDMKEQKMRIARSYGAGEPGIKSVISVVNLGHHWGAFFVDVHARRCFLFDPMQLPSNLATLKGAVHTIIEEMMEMTDQLQYNCITGCTQKDSSSCALWCLVVLELLLLVRRLRIGVTFGATPFTTWLSTYA